LLLFGTNHPDVDNLDRDELEKWVEVVEHEHRRYVSDVFAGRPAGPRLSHMAWKSQNSWRS